MTLGAGRPDGPRFLALSYDGRMVAASAPASKVVQFWDTKSGDNLGRFDDKTAEGKAANYDLFYPSFTPDGKHLVSVNRSGEIVLWGLKADAVAVKPPDPPDDPKPDPKGRIAEVKIRATQGVKSPIGRQDHMTVSADGKRALSSNASNLCAWSLVKEPRPLKEMKSNGPIVLALTPDGKQALSGHIDKSLQLWDLEAGKGSKAVGETPHQVMFLSLSAKGDRAILGGGGNGNAWIWDVGSGKEAHAIKDGRGLVVTALLPDGKRFLTAAGRTLTIWDAASGERQRVLNGSGRNFTRLAVSANGKLAATASETGDVVLWDVEGEKELRRLEGLPESNLAVSVAISPDGRLVAACSLEGGPGPGHLRFWDAASGKEVGKFDGKEYFLRDIAFADNFRLVALGWPDTVEELKLAIRTAMGEDKVETPMTDPTPVDRKPRPSEELVKDAIEKIRKLDEFKKDFDKLSSLPDASLRTLSDALLQKATQTKDDPQTRFALMQEARDVAAKGRDPARSIKAVEALAREFDIDAVGFKVEALKLIGRPPNQTVADAVLKAFVALADEVKAADNYASVGTLADVVKAATALAAVPLKKTAEERLAQLQYFQKEYDGIKQAMQTLKDKPDDPVANTVVGRWQCLAKHEWEAGLPMLVKGVDPALAGVARKDLEAPTDSKEQEALAKAWDELAGRSKDPTKSEMEKRAYHWYVRATELSKDGNLRLSQLARKFPEIQGPLDQLDAGKFKVTDGYLHLNPFKADQRSVASRKSYSSPIEITIVARTAKNNIRVKAFQGAELLFNWENKAGEMHVHRPDRPDKGLKFFPGSLAGSKMVPLEANKWYTIRWKITDKGTEVAVDGKVVFTEVRAYDLSKGAPVEMYAHDSAVDVKSFNVKSVAK
jgi:hypothetical protein